MYKRNLKILSSILGFILIFQQSGFAQLAAEFDIAGHIANFHNSFVIDRFRPIHLRYLQYDPLNNNFRLFLDKGDQFPQPNETNKLDEQAKELLKYFYLGLTLPNSKFWVNLRPDAEYNIIDDYLAETDIGRIMLETDLQLKKDTATMTSPQCPEGRRYWDKLYKKASELYGYDNVTIPTLTRPWIVPGEIIIRENEDSAYIYKATLKVMLEQDYIATSESAIANSADYSFKDERAKALNEYSTRLIRELIIPKLTKEVNSSKRYAGLRQVYYSLIMAQWFKARFKEPSSGGTVPQLIDSQDITNLISQEAWSKTAYFQAYKKSFKDGEYNIQEPVYTPTGQVIRSYFSGGEQLGLTAIPLGDINGPMTSIRVNSSPVINEHQGDDYYLIETKIPITNNPGEGGTIGSSPVKSTIRKVNEGFVTTKEGYVENVSNGSLPSALAGYDHSLEWPVDMRNPKMHIAGFWEKKHYGDPKATGVHEAIDIQVPNNTEIRPVEDGRIIFVDTISYVTSGLPGQEHLADVFVYSPRSNIIWVYSHLDKRTIPDRILKMANIDIYDEQSNVQVNTNDMIGKITSWMGSPHSPGVREYVEISAEIESVYGRSFNHLHLEARYLPLGASQLTGLHLMDVPRIPTLNPLLLLKRLYPSLGDSNNDVPIAKDRANSTVANTTEAAISFLKTELYNYLVGLCRDNMLIKTHGIKVSSYRQLLIRTARIDPEIATYLEKVIKVISNITLFKGADEDSLEEAVIALNDHGFKKYGLCISLDPLVYRESSEERPLLTSLDYKIYKILDVEAALNPLMPENRINVYVLDEVATDYKKAIARILPPLPREKSGHMFKDRKALASKETGFAGPKVYIKNVQEEIESAKIGPSNQEDQAISLLGELVRKFYNAETDEKLLKLERRRIAAHEVGHVYALFTVSETLDEEKDELLAHLYSLMEEIEGNRTYLAKLIIKAMQIESSDITYFDPVTGYSYIPPPLQAFVTLKENIKNVLGISNQSNLELANRIAELDEGDIPGLARRIFKKATGKDPVAIIWQAASPVRTQKFDLTMKREEKSEHIKAVYNGSTGARMLNTSGEGFGTMSIYNYYYRSGSFRNPYAYLWQIKTLGEKLGNPDLFNDLLSFVKKLTAEDGKEFYLYSVINPSGSLGLGLRSSILEGDPLLTTSRQDFYGEDNFTIFVGRELFEYLTRRNSADDLPDVDLFVTYELIWQEILRYYFKEADQKITTKIKAAIKKEADEERKFQKELSYLAREVLNASSGWDRDLGENEIHIRALARKLSETQDRAWAKFYGWREIGAALFDNDLIERMNENQRLDISAIGSGQGVSPSGLALAIANEGVSRGLRSKAEQLSEEDKGLFRYLSFLKDELLKTKGAQLEFRLIGSHLPKPIGQAVAFLEVAFFPPVGADFSGSLGEFLGDGKGITETAPVVVYSFSPNVSFSFRARQRSEQDYEIQITPMDDPHKSPVTVVRIPKDASFEEVLIRVIKALPEQPKALFYKTSIEGFRKLADSLLQASKKSQIEILRKFRDYISSHTEQRAFNDSLPYGTEHIPPLIIANELAFWAQDTQKRKAASIALASLQQVFGNIAGHTNNLQIRKIGIKSLTTGNTGNSASPVSQAMIKETLNSTDKGGIDFRGLPIITQAMSNLKLSASSSLSLDSLQNINPNQKLGDIQKMVKSGIVPSTDRIKEYVASSCLKGDLDIQKIISCIANILRLEEEYCTQTDPMLRDILVVLESSGSMENIKAIFKGAA